MYISKALLDALLKSKIRKVRAEYTKENKTKKIKIALVEFNL